MKRVHHSPQLYPRAEVMIPTWPMCVQIYLACAYWICMALAFRTVVIHNMVEADTFRIKSGGSTSGQRYRNGPEFVMCNQIYGYLFTRR